MDGRLRAGTGALWYDFAMTQETPTATLSGTPPSVNRALYHFTRAFFTRFGATVDQAQLGPADALTVQLSPELAAHFDTPQLELCFHQTDAHHGELVAFGSRIYDQMLAYLEQRSALTAQILPKRFTGGEEIMAALHPVNAGITGLRVREAQTRWVAFDWQITYRADDKREELFTVLLDDAGTLLDRLAHDHRDDSLLPETTPAPEADTPQHDANAAPTPALIEMAFAHGHTPESQSNDDAAPQTLPPMTQLTRLAETARKYAIYHADLRCIEHEADILPRLHKTLSRLTSYYNQQIEEVHETHDPDGVKRRALEADLERKVAEEVENHRLRVQVNLLSYAVFDVPVARAAITLSDGRVSADVTVERNLFTGTLSRPRCHACGSESAAIALDRNGHLTCDACIEQCDTCQEIYCAACGVEACPVCNRNNCAGCGRECMACGARACTIHADRCPTCGDLVCHDCQTGCAACGVRQCRSHLRRDAVAPTEDHDGRGALICPTCAVRCPGCQQYSAQLGICEQSGQRFCRNCLHSCATCGRTVGPGFYEIDAEHHAIVCHNCTVTCPTCGAYAPTAVACTACGNVGCDRCMAHCDACGAALCREHAVRQENCGHIVCAQHATECAIGGEFACPVCRTTCSICNRPHCDEHSSYCKRCQQEFCSECVRLSGLCDVCAHIDRDGEFVTLVDEPCAADVRVQLIMSNYRWVRLDSVHLTHYMGRDASMQAALIVVTRTPPPTDEPAGRTPVVHVRRVAKLGMLDTPHRDRWTQP